MIIQSTFQNNGVPAVGLIPVITIYDLSDNSVVVNAAAMSEVANGIYKYTFAAYVPTEDYAFYVDGGAILDPIDRYSYGCSDILEEIRDKIDGLAVVSFPAGGIAFTYTMTNSLTGAPIQGVEVWISTDSVDPPVNVVWKGTTDTFGVARSVLNDLPHLNAGTYYFWRKKPGFTFAPDPDIEVVS